ncbi:MAG: ParB/RepB/Spo0J family partition protein [Treponema sp.]|nr:ParB/RepB/Spo0J family partition protein [Treponema sp.]
MAPKHGLGKGLDALLPRGEDGGSSSPQADGWRPGRELFIDLEKLQPNPDQPRRHFDEAELRELADSIREHGIIEPVIAEEAEGGNYTIVAGERRCRAARIAGLSSVPVILRSYSEEKRMEVSLVENIQRADLNPIEEALAYRRLMEAAGLSQNEVSVRVGRNRSTVANALRLLKLPRRIRDGLENGSLSPGHARAVLAVPDEKGQELLFDEIIKQDLSVRDAEKRAAALNRGASKGKAAAPGGKKGAGGSSARRAPELKAMEEKFIGKLGTRVIIDGDLDKGRIHIDYYSMEDLERLYEILGG